MPVRSRRIRWKAGALVGVLAVILVAPAEAGRVARLATPSEPSLARAIAAEVNARRTDYRMPSLRFSAKLARAARNHASSMATLGFFGHSSPDGSSSSSRILSYYATGGERWSVGEVIIWATGSLTPAEVVNGWLASSSHRRTLLNGHWTELGVGAVQAQAAPGVFGGRAVTIVVADFSARGSN